MKCHKCKRVVKRTTHLPDSFKIDYYIVEGVTNEEPVVECVVCRLIVKTVKDCKPILDLLE